MKGTPTARAALAFAWLRAVKRDHRLKHVDRTVALDLVEWPSSDGTFFRSAAAVAEAVGVSTSTAEAAIGRLRQCGLLHKVEGARPASSRKVGRAANTYCLTIPDDISPEMPGETPTIVSPEDLGKKRRVSPENSGRVSPENLGAISLEEPLEGGRAKRAPAQSSEGDGSDHEVVVLEDDAPVTDGRAPDGAPVNPGGPPFPLPTAADHDQPMTLDDIDRLAAEEQAAAAARGSDAPVVTADPLVALGLSGEDLDPLRDDLLSVEMDAAHRLTAEELAAAFIRGFVYGDAREADRIVADTTHVLGRLAGLDDFASTPAEHVAALCASLRPLARRIDPERAEAAVAAFLARIGHEPPAPAVPQPAADPLAEAAATLRHLHGDALPDPGGYLDDLARGADEPALLERAATVALITIRTDGRSVWPEHLKVVENALGEVVARDLTQAMTELAWSMEDRDARQA